MASTLDAFEFDITLKKQMRELQSEIDLLKNGGGCIKREFKSELLTSLLVDDNGVIDLTD